VTGGLPAVPPPPISALDPGMLGSHLIAGESVRLALCSRCHQWAAVRGGQQKAAPHLPPKGLAFWLTARY
jgi:hypothetical protein